MAISRGEVPAVFPVNYVVVGADWPSRVGADATVPIGHDQIDLSGILISLIDLDQTGIGT